MTDNIKQLLMHPMVTRLHHIPANEDWHPEVSTWIHTIMNLALMRYGIEQGVWGSNSWTPSIKEDAQLIAVGHDMGKWASSQFTMTGDKRRTDWLEVPQDMWANAKKFNSIGHEFAQQAMYQTMREYFGGYWRDTRYAFISAVVGKHMQKQAGKKTAQKMREHFSNPKITDDMRTCRQVWSAIITTDYHAKAVVPYHWIAPIRYGTFSVATTEPTEQLMEDVYQFTMDKIASTMTVPSVVHDLGMFERYA